MTRLNEIATVIRSKNAGPFVVTFDVFLPDEVSYDAACDALTVPTLAMLFGVAETEIQSFVTHDLVRAIKFSIPRRNSSGSSKDRDVYGAQQYAPLLGVELAL